MTRLPQTWRWIRIGESVLLALAGIALIIWPAKALMIFGLILGVLAMLYGAVHITFDLLNRHDFDPIIGLIVGGAYVAIGIVLVALPPTIIRNIIGILMGVLFIADGLSFIAQGIHDRRFGDYWIMKLIVGVIVAGGGVFMMFNADESAEILVILVGAVFIYMGLSNLFSVLFLQERLPRRNRYKKDADIIDVSIIDHQEK